MPSDSCATETSLYADEQQFVFFRSPSESHGQDETVSRGCGAGSGFGRVRRYVL